MKLYRVIFDGEPDYVEAETLGEAVVLWRANLIRENEPGDIAADQDPESMELVHEKAVVRAIRQAQREALEAAAVLMEDGECMPKCDSIAHEELCPVAFPGDAIRALVLRP